MWGTAQCVGWLHDDLATFLSGKEYIRFTPRGQYIGASVYAGTIFLVGDNGDGNFCDLTDEQVETYSNLFAEPEEILDEEVQADSGFFFYSM